MNVKSILLVFVWTACLFICSPANAIEPNKLIKKPIEAAKKPIEAAKRKLESFKKEEKKLELRDKWALIVSLDKFHDKSIAPIKFAQHNALLMAGLLSNPEIGKFGPKHVLTVTNQKAIKKNIAKCLSEPWLYKHALPKDLVLLYFCTRYIPTEDGEDLRLCFYETDKVNPEAGTIKLKETLKEIRRRTQSPYIVSILDISPAMEAKEIHRDEIATAEIPNSDLFKKIADQTGTTILAGNRLGMTSYHSSVDQSSFLVANLIEGFKAGSGEMDLKTIAEYVQESVKSQVESRKGRLQMPVFEVPESNQIASTIVPAIEVKSSKPEYFNIGHPLSDYPELAKREMERQRLAKAQTALPKPKPKPSRILIEEKSWEDDDSGVDEDAAVGEVDFGPYMKKMKRTIQQKWAPPKGFKARSVVAVFSIRRDGKIMNPEIVDGSGVDQVDKSAMEALNTAKLDPLPRGAPPYVQIRYQFDWKVTRNR